MKKSSTLCFSGHRNLPTEEQLETLTVKLRTAIETAIEDGYDTFLFGGCYGFDLLAAEMVLALKQDCPHIMLHAIIPYEEQHVRWTAAQREQYFVTMAQCATVNILHPPSPWAKQRATTGAGGCLTGFLSYIGHCPKICETVHLFRPRRLYSSFATSHRKRAVGFYFNKIPHLRLLKSLTS